MRFKPYSSYHESGTHLPYKVPSHWRISRLGRFLKAKGGAGFPDEYQGNAGQEIPFLKVANLGDDDARKTTTDSQHSISYKIASLLGAEVFKKGTVVFAKVGAALLLERYKLLDQDSCIDNNMMAIKNSGELMLDEYIRLFLSTISLKRVVNPGAVPSINASQVHDFIITIPPHNEQISIKKFLRHETAKIDALIAEQKRLIELLQEKRKAVISHAVTKGLNPNAPMKDSGVEWLGKVPEHWRTTRLGHHAKAKGGAGFPDIHQGNTEEEIAFLKVANLGNHEHIADTDGYEHTISKETATKLRAEVYKQGSIVFAKVGAALLLERYRLLAQDSCIDNNMMTIMNDEKIITNIFLRISLSTVRLKMIVNPGAVPSINASQVHGLKLAFPPIQEQIKICKYIEHRLKEIDSFSRKSKIAIELLKERRSALISAAVTGQIDVRGHVSEDETA